MLHAVKQKRSHLQKKLYLPKFEIHNYQYPEKQMMRKKKMETLLWKMQNFQKSGDLSSTNS